MKLMRFFGVVALVLLMLMTKSTRPMFTSQSTRVCHKRLFHCEGGGDC